MSSIKTFFSLIKTPIKMVEPLGKRKIFNWMPDAMYLKLIYRARLGETLNLKNPRTFNEKIQWLKIKDHNPEYVEWVDKIKAKEKVAELLGSEMIVPTIGVWKDAKDINFSELPSKCVLKCSHDQGSTIIYTKDTDKSSIIKYFNKRLKRNPYPGTREWPYKNIEPRILCEPFLDEDIIDYKFFCFNGKVQMINIGQKNSNTHITHVTFLDKGWTKMSFQRSDFLPVNHLPEKPKKFEKLLEVAEKIAEGTSFVRVDFYYIDNKIYFSEYTLYPTSGFIKFEPKEGDRILGNLLQIKL